VSEQIINGTSTQLGYRPTVPLMLVHAGKYRREDKLKNTDDTQTKHNPQKTNNAKHSKTKLAGFSDMTFLP